MKDEDDEETKEVPLDTKRNVQRKSTKPISPKRHIERGGIYAKQEPRGVIAQQSGVEPAKPMVDQRDELKIKAAWENAKRRAAGAGVPCPEEMPDGWRPK